MRPPLIVKMSIVKNLWVWMLHTTTRSSTAKNTLIKDTFEHLIAIKTLDIIKDEVILNKVQQAILGWPSAKRMHLICTLLDYPKSKQNQCGKAKGLLGLYHGWFDMEAESTLWICAIKSASQNSRVASISQFPKCGKKLISIKVCDKVAILQLFWQRYFDEGLLHCVVRSRSREKCTKKYRF